MGVGNEGKYRLIDVDGKGITPTELAEIYFSSPEDCFIKVDETVRDEERAPINNLVYSQNILHKITPPACNNILTELYNNSIEVSHSKDIQKYGTAPVKSEPQEKSASLGTDKRKTNHEISSESIRSHRLQLIPGDNSFTPIVSVEDFFSSKQPLPLPQHSFEQSPCYPIIGSKSEGSYTMYRKIHPKVRNTNLESIEHHCRFAEPDHHKSEIISRMELHI
jgi:hypothetical protein